MNEQELTSKNLALKSIRVESGIVNPIDLSHLSGTGIAGKMKMGFSQSIQEKLEADLNPASLEIINESHLHAGHQESFDGSGETHLRIRIVADRFEGMSRLDRHRVINALVAEEIAAGLHALAIEAKAPSEIR